MISLLWLIASLWAAPEPSSVYGPETGAEFRYLQRWHQYSLLGEGRFRNELDGVNYRQLMVGAYRRFHPKWRWGGFLQEEEGVRWGKDWRKVGGKWGWQDEEGRWDLSVVGDLTYREETSLERLVFEWKNRAYWYARRDALQWRTRPAVNYFIMKNDRPWWQLNAAAEYYFPLNYQQGKLAETWYYLQALYHVERRFMFGPQLAWRQRWFQSPDNFEKRFDQSWESKQESLFLGLSFIWVESD